MNIRIALARIPPEYLSAIQTSIEKNLALLNITVQLMVWDAESVQITSFQDVDNLLNALADSSEKPDWLILDRTHINEEEEISDDNVPILKIIHHIDSKLDATIAYETPQDFDEKFRTFLSPEDERGYHGWAGTISQIVGGDIHPWSYNSVINQHNRYHKPIYDPWTECYLIVDKDQEISLQNFKVIKSFRHFAFSRQVFHQQYERFNRVVMQLKSCLHPGIPKILDSFFDPMSCYIIQEFTHGGTFLQGIEWLKKHKEKAIPIILDWMLQASDILQYLADLPEPYYLSFLRIESFVVNLQGQVCLVHFNEKPRILEGRWYKVHPFGVKIDPPHHAQEALEHKFPSELSEASSVFCLGSVLSGLLDGLEYEGDLRIHLYLKFSLKLDNPNVSKNLADVIEKARQVRPEDRYQTIAEFKAELQNELDNLQNQ